MPRGERTPDFQECHAVPMGSDHQEYRTEQGKPDDSETLERKQSNEYKARAVSVKYISMLLRESSLMSTKRPAAPEEFVHQEYRAA